MAIYTIRTTTAGAAAPKTHITSTAPANARVKLRGLLLGNTAATATQGVEWEILRLSVNATGSAQTPNPLNPDDIASRTTATSTITAEGTSSTILVEFGFDVLTTYPLWFPGSPVDLAPQYVNSGILALRKTIGADTTNWAITWFFEE